MESSTWSAVHHTSQHSCAVLMMLAEITGRRPSFVSSAWSITCITELQKWQLNWARQLALHISAKHCGIEGKQHVCAWVHYLGDCERRAPLLFEDVKADAALAIDVGVVHLCLELHFGRLEGIVWRELYHDKEDASRVRAVPRSHDCCLHLQSACCEGLHTMHEEILGLRAKKEQRASS